MANVKEYSVEEKLASLVTLQKIDSKLDEIHILKGELPMEVADLEDEIQGLHARQLRIEEEINGITEFIEQKKEGIVEAKALIAKYEKQSENVKNNREFEAINKEIEMQQLEEKLCEKHIKDATAARSHVDERLLTSYDRIRKNYRNGLAVVPVERDSCGGCFHAIPPQKQSEIKLRKKVIVCENCGRILVDNDLNDSIVVK